MPRCFRLYNLLNLDIIPRRLVHKGASHNSSSDKILKPGLEISISDTDSEFILHMRVLAQHFVGCNVIVQCKSTEAAAINLMYEVTYAVVHCYSCCWSRGNDCVIKGICRLVDMFDSEANARKSLPSYAFLTSSTIESPAV